MDDLLFMMGRRKKVQHSKDNEKRLMTDLETEREMHNGGKVVNQVFSFVPPSKTAAMSPKLELFHTLTTSTISHVNGNSCHCCLLKFVVELEIWQSF